MSKKKKNRRRVLAWMIYMKLICATLCKDGFQFNIITKNDIWVFIQLIRWARCDLYYIFTVIDSYQKKKKKTTTREWEGMGVILREWNGIFLQFFRGIGTGRD